MIYRLIKIMQPTLVSTAFQILVGCLLFVSLLISPPPQYSHYSFLSANCHGPGKGVPKTYANFLGLALLDRDLNVVKDHFNGEYLDAVIDINKHLWEKKWTPLKKKRRMPTTPKQFMQDCQIVPARSSRREKSKQLILLCNEYGTPIQLKLRQASTKSTNTEENKDHFISFSNMYGNELHLIAQEKPNMIVSRQCIIFFVLHDTDC